MNFLTLKRTNAVGDQSIARPFLRKQRLAALSFVALVVAVTFGLSSCEYPGDQRYGGSYYGGYGPSYSGYGTVAMVAASSSEARGTALALAAIIALAIVSDAVVSAAVMAAAAVMAGVD